MPRITNTKIIFDVYTLKKILLKKKKQYIAVFTKKPLKKIEKPAGAST